jgi:hypothetical protein
MYAPEYKHLSKNGPYLDLLNEIVTQPGKGVENMTGVITK